MDTLDILMIIAGVCVIWSLVSLILISKKVSDSGTRVRFHLITLLFFRYVSSYEALTRKKTGRTGPLVYHFVIPLWIALILVLIWILATMTGSGT